jgi:hypothetical protein
VARESNPQFSSARNRPNLVRRTEAQCPTVITSRYDGWGSLVRSFEQRDALLG